MIDSTLNLVAVCCGDGRWMKWLRIVSCGGLLVLLNCAKTDIRWHVTLLFITWPLLQVLVRCRSFYLFTAIPV